MNKILLYTATIMLLLQSCKKDLCNTSKSNDPNDIVLWFTLNDRISGDDLFFGENPPYQLDAVAFDFNLGDNDYIVPVEGQYFELSGLFPNAQEDYYFTVFYENTPLGVLKITYDRSSNDDCDVNKANESGLQMIFNEEPICSNCLRETVYKIFVR